MSNRRYRVLVADNASDLEDAVESLLSSPTDQGTWRPVGGVSVAATISKRDGYTEIDYVFAQAMHEIHF